MAENPALEPRADNLTVAAQGSRTSRARARLTVARADMSRRVSDTWTRFRTWLGQHVTVSGFVAIAVALAATTLGIIFGAVEWILPGLTALFLLIIALFFLIGGNNYDVDLGVLQDHVVAGEAVSGTVKVTNTSRTPALPGMLEIPIGDALAEAAVPFLMPQGHSEQELAIPARKRGLVDVGPVRSIRADPVGLLHRDIQWTEKHTLYVHPKTVNLPVTARGFVRDLEGTPSAQLVTDDISFHAIREYTPGDSPRNIHWKTTAKTGALMVRQFEETRKSMVGVLLSLNEGEYTDEEGFELAISAAASLSVRFIRDHQELEILTSKEIPESARQHFASVRRLAVHDPVAALNDFTVLDHGIDMMTLEDIARVCSLELENLSNAFLVTGAVPSLRQLQTTAQQFGPETSVIIVRVDLDSRPKLQFISGIPIFTLGALEDLRHLMSRVVQA